jgi:hypothetical protein
LDKDIDKRFQELERRVKTLEIPAKKGSTTKVEIKAGEKTLQLIFEKGNLTEVKEVK